MTGNKKGDHLDFINYFFYLFSGLIDSAIDQSIHRAHRVLRIEHSSNVSEREKLTVLVQCAKDYLKKSLSDRNVQDAIQKASNALKNNSIPEYKLKDYMQYTDLTLKTTLFDEKYHEAIDHMMQNVFSQYHSKILKSKQVALQRLQTENITISFEILQNLIVIVHKECTAIALDERKLIADMNQIVCSKIPNCRNADPASCTNASHSETQFDSHVEFNPPRVDGPLQPLPDNIELQVDGSEGRTQLNAKIDQLFEGQGDMLDDTEADMVDLTISDDEEEDVKWRDFRFMTPAPSRPASPEIPATARNTFCPPLGLLQNDEDVQEDGSDVDMLQDEEDDSSDEDYNAFQEPRKRRNIRCRSVVDGSSIAIDGITNDKTTSRYRSRPSAQPSANPRSMGSMVTKWMGSKALCLRTLSGQEEEKYMLKLRRLATRGFRIKPFRLKNTNVLRACTTFTANRQLTLDFYPRWLQGKGISTDKDVLVKLIMKRDATFSKDGEGKGAKLMVHTLTTNDEVLSYHYEIKQGACVSGQILQDALELRRKDKRKDKASK